MSWDAYITSLKAADQNGTFPVAEAAICGMKTGEEAVWAQTPGMAVSVDEIKKLCCDRSGFAQNGVYIGGQRCRLIRDQLDTDQVNMLDLKTAADTEGNTYGVCVAKTNKAFIIVKGTKEASGGQLSNKVYGVADYLKKSGY